MTHNVDPAEAAALRAAFEGDPAPSRHVKERDFRRPIRLGRARLEALEHRLLAASADVADVLSDLLDTPCRVVVERVEETSAAELFHFEEDAPRAGLRFEIDGALSWILWRSPAAVRAVEHVLGSETSERRARRLTPIEESILAKLLSGVADTLCAALGLRVDVPRVAQTREELGDWQDHGCTDPHRLHVALSIAGNGDESTLDLYVPIAGASTSSASEPRELPPHLEGVEVRTSVRIAGCELPLAVVLGLEEGDVIPLDSRLGEPASLLVEGSPFAHGELGAHAGHLAIRIERVDHVPKRAA